MSKYTVEQVRDRLRAEEKAAIPLALRREYKEMADAIDALLRERELAKAAVTGGIVNEAFGAFAHAFKDKATFEDLRAALVAVTVMLASVQQPIPMILHCPSCHAQHIDRVETDVGQLDEPWMNPPHRSHLCHNCGTIWRPADVPTTGVEKIQTRGKNDAVATAPMLVSARVPDG